MLANLAGPDRFPQDWIHKIKVLQNTLDECYCITENKNQKSFNLPKIFVCTLGLITSVLDVVFEKFFYFWKAKNVQDIWSGKVRHSAGPEAF